MLTNAFSSQSKISLEKWDLVRSYEIYFLRKVFDDLLNQKGRHPVAKCGRKV